MRDCVAGVHDRVARVCAMLCSANARVNRGAPRISHRCPHIASPHACTIHDDGLHMTRPRPCGVRRHVPYRCFAFLYCRHRLDLPRLLRRTILGFARGGFHRGSSLPRCLSRAAHSAPAASLAPVRLTRCPHFASLPPTSPRRMHARSMPTDST